MVLGGATQKIQTIVELAEDLYEKVTELREELLDIQETVQPINPQATDLEADLEQHRVILEAIAEEHDISIEELFEGDEDSLSGNDP
jgi:chromosome segregation ATPase